MRFRAGLLALMLLLPVGCALEPEAPPAEALPLPPVPPPRPPGPRAERAAEPATVPETAADPAANAGAAAAEAGPAPAQAATEAPAEPWRVQRDGTPGCADPATLRLLRGADGGAPRLIAEARRAGGCRTTFRVNAWTLDGAEGDLVRLRLVNGTPLVLWFFRSDVTPP